jgi:dUTP pyrophosphatase
MKINYKILDNRITPEMLQPATPDSAGIDLRACIDDKVTIKPGECVLIPSGIAIHINDPGYAGFIFPRSGLGHKQGLVLGNLTGVIDSDYQGQIMVSAWNRNQTLSDCVIINPLDRIAQLVFMPVMRPRLELVESFEESVRGVGGFGSTDKTIKGLSNE